MKLPAVLLLTAVFFVSVLEPALRAQTATQIWARRYNGPGNDEDIANAVAVDGAGNVIVTGYSYNPASPFAGANPDYYTAKYAAADGGLLWERRYSSPDYSDDRAIAVVLYPQGNVIVTGTSNDNIYTAKYGH